MTKPNLTKQYARAVKGLQTIGQTTAISIEQIDKALTKAQKKYIEDNKGELVITPALKLHDLIAKIDEKQASKTYVWNDLWDKYDFGLEPRVDFIIPELKFTDQTFDEQMKLLAKEKIAEGVEPRVYLMAQLNRRENKEKFLDQTTWRRSDKFGWQSVDGYSIVGDVRSCWDQLALSWSDGDAGSDDGVGLSVGLNLSPLASPLLSSFSSTDTPPNPEVSKTLTELYNKGYANGWNDALEMVIEQMPSKKAKD